MTGRALLIRRIAMLAVMLSAIVVAVLCAIAAVLLARIEPE